MNHGEFTPKSGGNPKARRRISTGGPVPTFFKPTRPPGPRPPAARVSGKCRWFDRPTAGRRSTAGPDPSRERSRAQAACPAGPGRPGDLNPGRRETPRYPPRTGTTGEPGSATKWVGPVRRAWSWFGGPVATLSAPGQIAARPPGCRLPARHRLQPCRPGSPHAATQFARKAEQTEPEGDSQHTENFSRPDSNNNLINLNKNPQLAKKTSIQRVVVTRYGAGNSRGWGDEPPGGERDGLCRGEGVLLFGQEGLAG